MSEAKSRGGNVTNLKREDGRKGREDKRKRKIKKKQETVKEDESMR